MRLSAPWCGWAFTPVPKSTSCMRLVPPTCIPPPRSPQGLSVTATFSPSTGLPGAGGRRGQPQRGHVGERLHDAAVGEPGEGGVVTPGGAQGAATLTFSAVTQRRGGKGLSLKITRNRSRLLAGARRPFRGAGAHFVCGGGALPAGWDGHRQRPLPGFPHTRRTPESRPQSGEARHHQPLRHRRRWQPDGRRRLPRRVGRAAG